MFLFVRVCCLRGANIDVMSFLQVLPRSSQQGCKVDAWSAGVILLYLITGKTPFGSDPEQ
jgi:serine/threonine protein kinase